MDAYSVGPHISYNKHDIISQSFLLMTFHLNDVSVAFIDKTDPGNPLTREYVSRKKSENYGTTWT